MKTVCFVVVGIDSGGLENYLLRFINYKHGEFERIFVFCRGGRTGVLEEKFEEIPNVTIIPQRIGYLNPADYIKFYSFLKKNKIDSVCEFSGNIAGPVMMVSKIAGVKSRITQYRGASDHYKKNFLKNIYDTAANRMVRLFSTKVLSNSVAALDYFFPKRKSGDKKYEVIYNGIDADGFLSSREDLRKEFDIPQSAFVVGHTGRYNEAKNHPTILKVAKELCRRDKNIYVILCGNGVKDNLSEEIGEDLKARIITQNNRSDIIKVLNTMDCYYFPSLTEGQPNALIEAMTVGLPFVASDIPPILETVPESARSQLVAPLDWKGACEKIMRLKDDEQLRKDLDYSHYVRTSFNHTILFQRLFDNI